MTSGQHTRMSGGNSYRPLAWRGDCRSSQGKGVYAARHGRRGPGNDALGARLADSAWLTRGDTVRCVIVWINGTFGVGKTTTARLVQHAVPKVRFWDPEEVGVMLRTVVSDIVVRDFQDWSAWRDVVVATGHAVVNQTGQDLVAPQTVLQRQYMQQIADGFAAHSLKLFHVLLDAPTECLRERILSDADKMASPWRLEHVADYEVARAWMRDEADLVIDTGTHSAVEAAEQVVTAAGLR